jgi:hypothetical protein
VNNEEISETVCTHGNIDAKVSTVIGYRIKYFPTSVMETLIFFITYRMTLQPLLAWRFTLTNSYDLKKTITSSKSKE